MYVKQSVGTTLFRTLASLGDTATAGMDFADKIIRDKAQTDLLYKKAQLESDLNEFMNGLQQRNDYDNWDSEIDSFLEKQKSAMNSEAPNGYTARLYNQMLAQARPGIQQSVAQLAMRMQQSDMNSTDSAAMRINMGNLPGQDAINANSEIIFSSVAQGRMDLAQGREAVIKNANEAISLDIYNYQSKLIQDGVKSGRSWDDIKGDVMKAAMSSKYSVLMLDASYATEEKLAEAMKSGKGLSDISDVIDMKSLAEKQLKTGKAQWEETLENLQNQNYDAIMNKYYRPIHDAVNSPDLRAALKENGKNELDLVMRNNRNALSRDQKIHLENLFATDKESASGSGSGGKLKKSDIDRTVEAYVAAVFSGNESRLEGIETGHNAIEGIRNYVAELGKAEGATANETEEMTMYAYNKLIRSLEQRYVNDQSTSSLFKDVKDFIKNDLQGNRFSENVLGEEGARYLVQALADVDVTNTAQKDAALRDTKNYLTGRQAGILEEILAGKEQSSAFVKKHTKDGELKDIFDCAAEGTWALQGTSIKHGLFKKDERVKSKVVYTDIREAEVISPNADQGVKLVDEAARSIISLYLDEDASVAASWQRDGRHDYTGTRIYSANGKDYVINATSEKDFELLENGKLVATSKELKQKLKEYPKKKAAAEKEARKAEKQAAKTRKNQIKEDSEFEFTQSQNPSHYTPNFDWQNYDVPEDFDTEHKYTVQR